MNYTNGIGSPQQSAVASEAVAASSTGRTGKVESLKQASSAAPVDNATLSPTANIVAQALSGSDVRTGKVAALQQSIAAGTYSVPSSDVAAKVIKALLN